MITDLSVVEQRYRAVLEVLESEAKITDDRCPDQMPPEVEARVVEIIKAHPDWGPRTILSKLRVGPDPGGPTRHLIAARPC